MPRYVSSDRAAAMAGAAEAVRVVVAEEAEVEVAEEAEVAEAEVAKWGRPP